MLYYSQLKCELFVRSGSGCLEAEISFTVSFCGGSDRSCPKKVAASLAEQVLCEKVRMIFALEIKNSSNRTIPPQLLLCFLSISSCFVADTHKWFTPKVSGMVPGARDGHSACVLAKSMFIFGGYEQLVSSLCNC